MIELNLKSKLHGDVKSLIKIHTDTYVKLKRLKFIGNSGTIIVVLRVCLFLRF